MNCEYCGKEIKPMQHILYRNLLYCSRDCFVSSGAYHHWRNRKTHVVKVTQSHIPTNKAIPIDREGFQNPAMKPPVEFWTGLEQEGGKREPKKER